MATATATPTKHKITAQHRRTLHGFLGPVGWQIVQRVIDGASFTGAFVREAVAVQDFMEALTDHDGFRKEAAENRPVDTSSVTPARVAILLEHVSPVGWQIIQQCVDSANFQGSMARTIVELQDRVALLMGNSAYKDSVQATQAKQNGAQLAVKKGGKRKTSKKKASQKKATRTRKR